MRIALTLALLGSGGGCGEDACMSEVDTTWLISPAQGPLGLGRVAVDTNGDVFMVASLTNRDNEFAVEKYAAADGALLWTEVLEGIPRGPFAAVGGAVLLARYAPSSGGVVLTKLGDDGEAQWETSLDSETLTASIGAVAAEDDADVYVAGAYTSPGDPDTTLYEHGVLFARIDSQSGTPVWVRTFGYESESEFSAGDSATDIAVDEAGDVVAVGFADRVSDFEGFTLAVGGPFAVKLQQDDGAVAWVIRPGTWEALPATGGYILPTMVTGRGGELFVVAGQTQDQRVVVISSISTTGDLAWSREVGGLMNVAGIAIDPTSDDVTITGEILGPADVDGDGTECSPPSESRPCDDGGGDIAVAQALPRLPSGGCSVTPSRAFIARYSAIDGVPTGDGWFTISSLYTAGTDIAATPGGLAVAIYDQALGSMLAFVH